MITNKLFEEFQSCLDRTISRIIEPKNEYEELLIQFQGFLINELICVEFSECEIVTNEIIVIRFGDDEGYNIFHFTYHHEFDEIMFLERDDNNGFFGRINPAYEEVRENGFKLKESKMKIKIEIDNIEGYEFYNVNAGDKSAKQLTYDEALGLVSVLLMPKNKIPCLHWLKTDEQRNKEDEELHQSLDFQYEETEDSEAINEKANDQFKINKIN